MGNRGIRIAYFFARKVTQLNEKEEGVKHTRSPFPPQQITVAAKNVGDFVGWPFNPRRRRGEIDTPWGVRRRGMGYVGKGVLGIEDGIWRRGKHRGFLRLIERGWGKRRGWGYRNSSGVGVCGGICQCKTSFAFYKKKANYKLSSSTASIGNFFSSSSSSLSIVSYAMAGRIDLQRRHQLPPNIPPPSSLYTCKE